MSHRQKYDVIPENDFRSSRWFDLIFSPVSLYFLSVAGSVLHVRMYLVKLILTLLTNMNVLRLFVA